MAVPGTGVGNPRTNGLMWVAAFLFLAFAWKSWPEARGFVVIFVLILVFIMWVQYGGEMSSQVKQVWTGKAP